MITSQIDTAPKLLAQVTQPLGSLITSQIDTAPKLQALSGHLGGCLITSQIDTAPKLASQDYESIALFNDKDELIYISSQFSPHNVSYRVRDVRASMNGDGGNNFRDFHNHPMDEYTVQIFSPADVRGYVDCATAGKLTAKQLGFNHTPNGMDRVNKYSVQTQNGSQFTLAYTGVKTSSRTKTENFATAYSKAFNNHMRYYITPDQVTAAMIKWTQKNAPKYGFELSKADFIPYKK